MPELQTLIKLAAILMAICLVLSVLFHMSRAAIVFLIMLITVPMLCTIMWGDGSRYVARVASLFTPEIEQQINDGYRVYHDANAEDPVVDLDQIESYLDKVKGTVKSNTIEKVFPTR